MTLTAGFDVGGAHLKVALAEDGVPVAVEVFACPLWQGLDKLDAALAAARPLYGRASRHAITMTGELSDLFATRAEGVVTLVNRMIEAVGQDARFWMGLRGFGSAEEAIVHHTDTGSTNFLATAALAARHLQDALVIDFGSTTTDIIPIVDRKPVPQGLTDAVRLATGELVYTGYTRTAVMGIATRAPLAGREQGLAREYLATMADVGRILGTLPEGIDQHATADGRGKSLSESVTRLARMFGRDAGDCTLQEWQQAARFLREAQLTSIVEGCREVLRTAAVPAWAPIVAAGIGADEIPAIAAQLEAECQVFGDLIRARPGCRTAATHSAPAAAVAVLHSEVN